MDNALADFNSLAPNKVKKAPGGNLAGFIGYNKITVVPSGSFGRPTLFVSKSSPQRLRKIIYFDNAGEAKAHIREIPQNLRPLHK